MHLDHMTTGDITALGILAPAGLYGEVVRPATLVGWDGHEAARFGAEHRKADAERMMGPVFALDATQAWTPSGTAYALDLVSWSGDTLRHIARSVAWFPPHAGRKGFPWVVPPTPRITSIFVDARERIWLFIRRANRNWQPRTIGRASTNGPLSIRGLPSAAEVSNLFEGVIDVLDSKTGQLLASREVEGSVIGLTSSGMICAIDESLDGRISLRLSRLQFRP